MTPAAAVNILTDLLIDQPIERVSTWAADPMNAPEWYVNIQSVEGLTPPPAPIGTQVAFVAHFLGRRLAYTYENTEIIPGERLVMRTSEGPFPMETTDTWSPAGEGRTRMTQRNRGTPTSFSRLVGPLMASAMHRANRKDFALLKEILERG